MAGKSLRRLAAPALLLLGLALAPGARAQVTVFHSPNDDGQDPGQPLVMAVGPWESLFLYVNAGSAASVTGTPCFDGDGRELCGFDVTVDALGGASFVDFIPEPGIVHKLTPSQLRANGLFSLAPGLGPIRIGEVKVSSTQSGGEVMILSGSIVGAALQTELIPQATVATTPEPASWTMLVTGSLLVGRLARRRARGRRASDRA